MIGLSYSGKTTFANELSACENALLLTPDICRLILSVQDFPGPYHSDPKTGKVRAVRFSNLDAICKVLTCQPDDILEYAEGEDEKGNSDFA